MRQGTGGRRTEDLCQQPHDQDQCIYAQPVERVMRPGGLRLTWRLTESCVFARGAKVVDIGCGTGVTVEYLRDVCGLCATGVDISEVRLQQGMARSAGLPLIRADGEALPFASGSLDGVLAECSLSVMRDTGRVLAEMNRILVPGGKLAITDIYMREEDGIIPAGDGRNTGCISGIRTYGELRRILEDKDFSLKVWEDQSACLKEYIACFIMEHGSVEALWRCVDMRQSPNMLSRQAMKRKLGYFLLVAEKNTAETACAD